MRGHHGDHGTGTSGGLLGDSEPTGSFSAELLAPAHLLQLEVAGVGPV